MERLRRAHVLFVGLGGVGAYAAEMICRAGAVSYTHLVNPSTKVLRIIGLPKTQMLSIPVRWITSSLLRVTIA